MPLWWGLGEDFDSEMGRERVDSDSQLWGQSESLGSALAPLGIHIGV